MFSIRGLRLYFIALDPWVGVALVAGQHWWVGCYAICGGGTERERWRLLQAPLDFNHSLHNQIGPLWCWFLSGWSCARSRTLWVSPMTSPLRLGVSPAAAPTPRGVFNQRFEALFPRAGALGCVVCFAPCHLSSLSVCECGVTGSASAGTACAVCPTLCQSGSHHSHRSPLHPGACLRPSYPSG